MLELAKVLFVALIVLAMNVILPKGDRPKEDPSLIKADSIIYNYYLNEKEVRKAIKKEMRNRQFRKDSTVSI